MFRNATCLQMGNSQQAPYQKPHSGSGLDVLNTLEVKRLVISMSCAKSSISMRVQPKEDEIGEKFAAKELWKDGGAVMLLVRRPG